MTFGFYSVLGMEEVPCVEILLRGSDDIRVCSKIARGLVCIYEEAVRRSSVSRFAFLPVDEFQFALERLQRLTL